MADRTVKVTLAIDETGAVRALRTAGEESHRTEGKLTHLDKGVKELGKSFGGLKGMIGAGLGALGFGGVAFGLSSIASKTKEVAAETEKFHSVTGISAKSSLYYTQALKARGLSGETVGKAFGILAKNMKTAELQHQKYSSAQAKASATGKSATAALGRQAEAFNELGINLSEFNQLSEQQKLDKITKSFEKMTDSGKKTRLEQELFGKSGTQLSTVLDKNNLGLSHQIELAKKFYPEIKGGARGLQELQEKQAESKMAWEGLEFTLGQKLIPIMSKVFGWFSKTVQEVEKGTGKWGNFGHAVKEVGGFLREAWKVFEGLVGPTKAIQLALGAIVLMKFGGLLSALGPVGLAIAGIAAGAIAAKAALEALGITKRKEKLMDLFIKSPQAITANSLKELKPNELKELQHIARVDPEKGRYPKVLFKTPGQIAAEAKHENRSAQSAMELVEKQYNSPPASGRGSGRVEHHINLHITGEGPLAEALAHSMLRNPRARRVVAETVTKQASEMHH